MDMPDSVNADTDNLILEIPFYTPKNDLHTIRSFAYKSSTVDAFNDGGTQIDGRIYFVDDIPSDRELREDLDIVEFEVADRPTKMDTEYDMYCSTPESEELDDDLPEPELDIVLQEFPNGYLINNSCFIPWPNWHTIVPSTMSAMLLRCCVCAEYCDLESEETHADSERHVASLAAVPPLHKFDLAVTRRIGDEYHCGVCNEVFDVSEEFEHFSGKIHEGNLLFSINKASDILDNPDYKGKGVKIDTYQFKHPHQTIRTIDQESVASDTIYDNINYINFQNNYEDYDDDVPLTNYVTSYASMARKPKAPVQSFVEIKLGEKKVNVRYDSWHMIISPQPNRFWCMICRKYDHLRKKVQHCKEAEHLRNLMECKIVEGYGEYLIRQVNSDNKLYHCGHCNNLQWTHEMDVHLETTHPRRTRLVSETKVPASPTDTDNNTSNNTNTPVKNTTNNYNVANNTVATPVKNTNNNNKNVNNTVSTPVKNTTHNNAANNTVPTSTKNTINTNIGVINTSNINPIGSNINIAVNTNTATMNTLNNNNNASKNTINKISDKYLVTNIENALRSANNTLKNANNTVTNARNHPFMTPNQNNQVNIPILNPMNPIPNQPPYMNAAPMHFNTNAPPTASIIICPFGIKQAILCLSYNVICMRLNDFYCGLCDVIVPSTLILDHMYHMRHTELLLRTPFISHFNVNLIRAIREALHCALCNAPITADKIYTHTTDPIHIKLLQAALESGKNTHLTEVVTANNLIPPNNNTAGNNVNNNYPTNPQVNNNSCVTNIKRTEAVNKNTFPIITTGNVVANTRGAVTENNAKNMAAVNNTNDKAKGHDNDNIQDNIVKELQKTTTVKETNKIDKTGNIDTDDELKDTSFESEASEAPFEDEEFVYLKLKNTYIKINNTSYNTLVAIGDGRRYCFVCALRVDYEDLQKHVDSRFHLEFIEKYRFLEKYEDHLLRQIYLMYHCGICNVILTSRELRTHLDWPTHVLLQSDSKNIKKSLKKDLKGGVKQISVFTQKEIVYLHETESKIKIFLNANIIDKTEEVEVSNQEMGGANNMNKIIIYNDNVLKIAWESWHGISKLKNGFKCILCQKELKKEELDMHCGSEWHTYGLEKPFEKQFAPALIRKVTESTVNCLICNTEVSNRENSLSEHINGKKHIKNYEDILKDSSMANSYTDCHNDVLML